MGSVNTINKAGYKNYHAGKKADISSVCMKWQDVWVCGYLKLKHHPCRGSSNLFPPERERENGQAATYTADSE